MNKLKEIKDLIEDLKDCVDGNGVPNIHYISNRIADLDKVVNTINYIPCCETLKDKETPTLKDAFIAGYKKRALMSGLKYDEVSELNAITNFKCWKSFDLNL
jgi:hypothetical protein